MTITPPTPPGSAEPEAPAPRTGIRWRRHLALGLASLVALPIVAVVVGLFAIESPAVKAQVRRALQERLHVDVQWGRLKLHLLSGVRLDELRVMSPPPYDGAEPLLLRIGRIDASWSPLRLLRGQGPLLDELVLRDVDARLVADARGDSLRALLARLPRTKEAAPAKVAPLSRALADLLPRRAPVGRVLIEGVTLGYVRVPGALAEGAAAGLGAVRDQLRGLRLEAVLRPGAGGLEADVQAGAGGAPIDVRLLRTVTAPAPGAPGAARAQLQLGASLRGGVVRASGELRLGKQDLLRELPAIDRVLSFAGEARFLPAERRVAVSVERLQLLDSAAELALRAELPDDPPGGDGAKGAAPGEQAGATGASGGGAGAAAGAASPRIESASGRVDLLRLLPLVPLVAPEAGRPALARGQLGFSLSGLRLGDRPRLEPGGAVQADGEIADLRLPGDGREVALERLGLRARGGVEGDESKLHVDLPLSGLRASLPQGRAQVDGLALAADASRRGEGPAQLRLALPIALLAYEEAARRPGARGPRSEARDLRAELRATVRDAAHFDADLDLDAGSLQVPGLSLRRARLAAGLKDVAYHAAEPLRSRGAAQLRGRIGALTLPRGGAQLTIDDLGVELASRLTGQAPYGLELHLPMGRIAARRGGRALLSPSPGRLDLTVSGLTPAERPMASRARLKIEAALGALRLSALVDKAESGADYQLDARADSLALLRVLLPEEDAPFERMTLSLQSRGAVGGLLGAAPSISQRTSLSLGHAVLPGGDARADRVELQLDARGTARRHDATVDLRLAGLVLRGQPVGDGQLAGTVSFDLGKPSLKLSLKGQGSPEGQIALALDYARPAHELRYDADVRLAKLGVIDALLPAELKREHHVAWPKLRVALQAHGAARGVVRFTEGGKAVVAEDPLAALQGDQSVALELGDLRYEGGGRQVDAPELKLSAKVTGGDARRAELSASVPRLRYEEGERRLEARGLRPELTLVSRGDLRSGELSVKAGLALESLTGRGLPEYPIGDLRLDAEGQRDADGTIDIKDLRLVNVRGGTRLSARGGLDLTTPGGLGWRPPAVSARRVARGRGATAGERERCAERGEPADCAAAAPAAPADSILGRRSLSLTGRLDQDLGKVALVSGRGQAALEFVLESPDLRQRLYNVRGALLLSGAGLRRGSLLVEGARGRLPLSVELSLDDGRLTLLGDTPLDAFRLRYPDQHPFLGGADFVAMERLDLGGVSFGRLAGNARLDHNLLAVDQLEMRLRGGIVTGQLAVDYRGADSSVLFRGAVTGLRPSGDARPDERLDGSGVLSFGLRRRSLEGRADIVRISRRHLLDLLDVLDPGMESVGLNRVRLALKVGYPRSAGLSFEGGFASLRFQLGGLASGVRIDEVRGVPTGPLIERYLGDLLRELEDP